MPPDPLQRSSSPRPPRRYAKRGYLPAKEEVSEWKDVLEELRGVPLVGKAVISKQGKLRRRLLSRSTILVLCLAILTVPAALFWFLKHRAKSEADGNSGNLALFRTPDHAECLAALTDYHQARSIEERLKHVRAPQLMRPRMQAWYAKHSEDAYDSVLIDTLETRVLNERSYAIIKATRLPGRTRQAYVLERGPDGALLVDWEIASNYFEMPWGEFRKKRETKPKSFRCGMMPSNYYNWEFSDPTRHAAYMFVHPAEKDLTIFGYAERDTPLHRDLEKAYQQRLDTQLAEVTVELAFPEKAKEDNQVRITRLVSMNWIVDYEAEEKSGLLFGK